MILDTTFLVDLHREAQRRERGPAHRFLEAHPAEPLSITVVSAGEFAEGFTTEEHALCRSLLEAFRVHDVTEDAAWRYAEASRSLRADGARIGDNDLWIAATALALDETLVTRNVRHLGRIPHLKLAGY